MSQFYDLASLVVIPSGYKASTIYAQKPLTTEGQLSFSRASTATRVNASGLIEAVASDVPRLDYLGSSCPRLLLEPQRTNLVTYSEQFDNAAWDNAGGAVVSANTAVAPDGTTSADTATIGAGSEILRQLQTLLTVSASYTFTAYVKKSATSGANNVRLTVNNTLTWSGAVSTKIALTNNWQRVSLTWTASTSAYLIIGSLDQNGTDDTSCYGNVDIWGAQLEAGAYATSYIPTLGASVTRVADAASKTGISSLIGQTEGTIFVDFVANGIPRIINIYNNDRSPSTISTNAILIQTNGVIEAQTFKGNGTFQTISMFAAGYSAGQRLKIGFRYKSGDFALYVNGVQKATDSSSLTFIGTKTTIELDNNNQVYGFQEAVQYNQLLQFKTPLTNAQLAELTTL